MVQIHCASLFLCTPTVHHCQHYRIEESFLYLNECVWWSNEQNGWIIVSKQAHSLLYLNCGIMVAWQSLIAMSRLYKITAINLIENLHALQTKALWLAVLNCYSWFTRCASCSVVMHLYWGVAWLFVEI